jgi:hypothetical protein
MQYGKTAIDAIRSKTNDIYKTADLYLIAVVGSFLRALRDAAAPVDSNTINAPKF